MQKLLLVFFFYVFKSKANSSHYMYLMIWKTSYKDVACLSVLALVEMQQLLIYCCKQLRWHAWLLFG